MSEYYIVRDKNTGLYFRGKGVNRWGKDYNQASIYRIRKNAENTIKEVSWRGEHAEVVPIRIVEVTADVVEVVRCKDCIHYISPDRGYPYCSMFSNVGEGEYVSVSNDHYCSYGERRTN